MFYWYKPKQKACIRNKEKKNTAHLGLNEYFQILHWIKRDTISSKGLDLNSLYQFEPSFTSLHIFPFFTVNELVRRMLHPFWLASRQVIWRFKVSTTRDVKTDVTFLQDDSTGSEMSNIIKIFIFKCIPQFIHTESMSYLLNLQSAVLCKMGEALF